MFHSGHLDPKRLGRGLIHTASGSSDPCAQRWLRTLWHQTSQGREDRREWLDSGYDANFELTVDLNLDFISQNRPVQADVPIYGCSVHRWQDGNFCRRCGQRRQTSLSRAKNATAKAKAQREAAVDLNKKLCGVPQVSHQGTCMEVQKHQSPRVIQKQILCEARTLGVLRWHTMNPFMLWIAV